MSKPTRSIRRLILAIVSILLVSAQRLPAPIQEVPESPTPAPKPKRTIKPKVTSESSENSTRQDASSPQPKSEAVSKNGSGTATVFIYRPAGFSWGMYNGAVVTVDGAKVRTMADARYSVRKFSLGRHVFEITGGVVTHQRVSIPLDLQSDQTYYLRVSIDAWGFPEGKIIFARAPNEKAVAELAKLTQAP